MLEDIREATTRFGPGRSPLLCATAVLRQACQEGDRPANGVVANLSPRRIWADMDDNVLLGGHLAQEFVEKARLTHADVTDDSRSDEYILRVREAIVQPEEVLLATDVRKRELALFPDR